ncbi:hypothetical protein ACLOJK_002592 [Asimina triloba]
MANSFLTCWFFFFFMITVLAAQTVSSPIFFPSSAAIHQTLTQSKSPKSKTPYKAFFFPQQLDHFTFLPQSSHIFYQKYLLNSDHWLNETHQKGPIFVYAGNEGNIEWFADNTGFMFDIAPKFKALLLFIEHRFYGESKPFGKDSYKSAETLGYLNSQQALADYAVLIRSLKKSLSAEASPVVVFGGSYGGTIGALASSAPILHFDDITPWTSFYDAVSKDYKDASNNCFEVIKGSWDELMAFSAQKEGLQELSKTFRTCKDLHSVYSARDWLWSAFVYTAMVDYPMEANFMAPLPAYPVQEMCRIIDGFPSHGSKLTKAFSAASLYYNYSRTEKCFNVENSGDAHGLGGWDWQV